MSIQSEKVTAFIRRLCHTGPYDGHEQRRHQRFKVVMPVRVTPMDGENRVVGETFDL